MGCSPRSASDTSRVTGVPAFERYETLHAICAKFGSIAVSQALRGACALDSGVATLPLRGLGGAPGSRWIATRWVIGNPRDGVRMTSRAGGKLTPPGASSVVAPR